MKLQKWIVFNDTHFPFQDEKCIQLLLECGKRIRPDGYAILGDLIDFYSLSTFDKDPERLNNLQADIDTAASFLCTLRANNKKAQIIYIEGNHEKRLQKFLWRHPEINSLRSMNVEGLLELQQFNIKYISAKGKCAAKYRIGDMYFFHGSVIRKHSGYSAKAMYDKYGVTLMCGHTHRDGKYTKRTEQGHYASWENYCMCQYDAEYCDFTDWTQGWSVVTFADKRPYVEQIAVIKDMYIYGGKLYS